MNRIVRNTNNGKRRYDRDELAADPTLLPALREAEWLDLILPLKVGPASKSPATFGVPICVVVVGLTPAGKAMAAAG
jgi:hypothetical protein